MCPTTRSEASTFRTRTSSITRSGISTTLPPSTTRCCSHYHPLTIYRHQVIKQADVVLAMFLLGNEFPADVKKRNFDYYDPLTTGDSSLSACIQSIAAAEIGYMDKAMEYGRYAILMDLADVGHNVSDGCHIASMGGTWMVMVYGFAGMRDFDGELTFSPRLPAELRYLRFPLTIRGQTLEVEIDKVAARYTLREGTKLAITHFDEPVMLTPVRRCRWTCTMNDPMSALRRIRGEQLLRRPPC